jgi:hypothetical protein
MSFAFTFVSNVTITCFLFLTPSIVFAQSSSKEAHSHSYLARARAENLWQKQDFKKLHEEIKQTLGISPNEYEQFKIFLQAQTWQDLEEFLEQTSHGILTDANASQFLQQKKAAYLRFRNQSPYWELK